MDILVIGCGAIGSELARSAETMPGIGKVFLFDTHRERAEALALQLNRVRVVDSVDKTLRFVDLVIEAGSQEAASQFGPRVLEAGRDLMILSVGALTDEKLLAELERLATLRHANIFVPSGAIAGLDGLRAVRRRAKRVTLTTSKPPRALGIQTDERKVVFEGNAREAVARFPRNVNVAAAVSLAGIGSDRTTVRIVADPSLKRNVHEVVAEGDFGELAIRIEAEPSEANPGSSQLAYLSAVALLEKLASPTKVGT